MIVAACATGPSAADVAADRARWAAMRDVTADQAVDAAEAPHLAALFMAWDEKLTADEKRVASAATTWQDLARVYGAAIAQELLGAELAARAPDLFRFVDRNSDGVLSVDEIASIDPKNPVFAAVIVSTAVQLIARKNRG